MEKKWIIAHRGDGANKLENTLQSFEKAILLGADMVELDVRRTKDKVLIVHHNPLVRRKPISRLNWEDIEKINNARKFRVPRLEEVARLASGKIKLDAELKETGYEKEVLELLLKYLKREEFIITSFNDFSVQEIKKNDSGVKAGLLLSMHKPKKILSARRGRLLSSKRYQESQADFFLPQISLVKMGFLKKIKKYGKPIIVWSVNRKKTMIKLLQDESITGIITDKVRFALDIRGKMEK